ncbi:hypothetical protein ACTXT7_000685 [Hymenolepis weldensis]
MAHHTQRPTGSHTGIKGVPTLCISPASPILSTLGAQVFSRRAKNRRTQKAKKLRPHRSKPAEIVKDKPYKMDNRLGITRSLLRSLNNRRGDWVE